MSKALVTLQMPSPPDAVPVLIDPATTALLVFDVIEHICAREPKCREQLVPAVASLLERARQAGVTIAYGTRAANMSTWLPEVAPTPRDIKIESHAQDRFYNTDLDKTLSWPVDSPVRRGIW
jgi:isochorismate hydrolase